MNGRLRRSYGSNGIQHEDKFPKLLESRRNISYYRKISGMVQPVPCNSIFNPDIPYRLLLRTQDVSSNNTVFRFGFEINVMQPGKIQSGS